MISLNDLPGVNSSGWHLRGAGKITDQGQFIARGYRLDDSAKNTRNVVGQLDSAGSAVTSIIALEGALSEANSQQVVVGQRTISSSPDGSAEVRALRHDRCGMPMAW
jgi:hypothetical protein